MLPDDNPLAGIPELHTKNALISWIEEEVRQIRVLEIKDPNTVTVISFTGNDIHQKNQTSDANILSKFTIALFLADWACYSNQADREEYTHLKNAVTVFPGGFRLFMAQHDGNCIPIGYSGFHPIAKDTFYRLRKAPETITSRKQITPEPASNSGENYYYIYNLGIIKPFHRSSASRRLVKEFSNDIALTKKSALAAIVISPDGQRIVERFGLQQSGLITHDGHEEIAYVSKDTSALINE